MKRTKSIILLVLLTASLFVGSITYAANYQIIDLGLGSASTINNNGQILGSFGLYEDGVITPHSFFGASDLIDINDQGQILMKSISGSNINYYIYDNGTKTAIGGVYGFHAINNRTQVLGYSGDSFQVWGVLYDHNDGTFTTIFYPYSIVTIPYDMNNYGHAVGNIQGNGANFAFLWEDGTFSSVGGGGRPTEALVINDNGDIIIWDGSNGDEVYSVRWNNGERTIFDEPLGLIDLNNNGQILGYNPDTQQSFIYENGITTDLPTLGGRTTAYAINEIGQIVGSSVTNSGETHAVLWQPLVNVPGSRERSVAWLDTDDNLWLLGGKGYDESGNYGKLNDLWMFDGSDWTWVSGGNKRNTTGIYGTKGVADPANVPGARDRAVSWIDTADNLWLFGGNGYDVSRAHGNLNDLWKFDGTDWTWVSGASTRNQTGVYGTKGVAGLANAPGARARAVSWIDTAGNLWLFGGKGYDVSGNHGKLNDLWKFDGTDWTWVSGGNSRNLTGVYGIKGLADPANVPGARASAVSWIDTAGNLWLYGGIGYDSSRVNGNLNDLWMFDGSNWTWVSGSNTIDQSGVYGIKGIADSANVPGARDGAVSWIDTGDNLWLFGGKGYDESGNHGKLNDLWKFDGTEWTWVSGSTTIDQSGVYGN